MNKTICSGAAAWPHSESISKRILCLPHHYALTTDQVTQIAYAIMEIVK